MLFDCVIQGAKQRLTGLEKKGKSFMQMRKIRQFDEDFDASDFAETAQEIYIKTHDMLQEWVDGDMHVFRENNWKENLLTIMITEMALIVEILPGGRQGPFQVLSIRLQ